MIQLIKEKISLIQKLKKVLCVIVVTTVMTVSNVF